jgi:DNA mismatch repair protein MutL
MSDIIHLLPDSVANQIAAGEVIQRPASVVKELMENSIDSGASSIKVIIRDAGKTLIQVIDNGCGMSETDARMAFERHATSKIKKADDLFAIRSMGFRGEALASIAAIANVELKTKRIEDELGIHININASEFKSQEPQNCSDGSNFLVKSLFFNVPARRKFLKSNSTELKHIINQFQRIVLTYPEIEFLLIHNDSEIYNLSPSNLKKRVVAVCGRNSSKNFIDIFTDTSIVKISGFIGKPEFAKKTSGEQYFFVNKRFMRNPYFHKAVMLAYEKIIPPNVLPSYFIYFDINPEAIDINIHPTKTEIKFEDASSIFQLLRIGIKETLGKFNIVPSIDFNTQGSINIPSSVRKSDINLPSVEIDEQYNPFESDSQKFTHQETSPLDRTNQDNWENLYSGLERDVPDDTEGQLDFNESPATHQNTSQSSASISTASSNLFQFKNKYILTSVKSGLMIINQKRAHERILFEKFFDTLQNKNSLAQQSLFPSTLEVSAEDFVLLNEIIDDIRKLGFDIREFGKNTFVINGTPADFTGIEPGDIILQLIENYRNTSTDVKVEMQERIAQSLSVVSAIPYGKSLTDKEMQSLVDGLFACRIPNYSPSGKTVINIMKSEEFDKRLK